MNKAILTGRLTNNPDTRTSNGGMAVTRFTVAVDRPYHKQDDNTPTADFISCIAFDKRAEFIGNYFFKGSKITLAGHIQTGSYTNKDGQKVYTTDVIVDEAEFGESKNAQQKNDNKDSEFVNKDSGVSDELPFN